jgi:hypothetical protein
MREVRLCACPNENNSGPVAAEISANKPIGSRASVRQGYASRPALVGPDFTRCSGNADIKLTFERSSTGREGISMRFLRNGLLAIVQIRTIRRLTAFLIVPVIVATPLAIHARDRDKPGKEKRLREKDKARENDKPSVAAKEADSTQPPAGDATPRPILAPALEAARASRDDVRKMPGYICTFIKNEQLKKGSLMRQVMFLKFRREPFSVYLKFVEPHAGREVIYVEGQNKGRMQVHETSGLASIIGTVSLAPTGSDAMKESRHPVTMIGMEKMLETVIADWEEALKHSAVKVDRYPQAKIGDTECLMFEVVFSQPHDSVKFHKTRLYVDKKNNLPRRVEQYAFPAKAGEQPPLVEEYSYSDVKTDAPLADRDFDVNNDNYGFR